jgi:uncharacterized protein involved in exopolysaccharide biosynthesis
MKYLENPLEFTLINVFRLLRINFKLVTAIVTVFTIFIAIVSFIVPHEYVSTSSLMPPKKDGSGGGLSSFIQNFTGGGLSLGSLGQSDQSKVFGEIVKSRTVADYIIDTLKLKEKYPFKEMLHDRILKFIKNSLSVDVDKSGIIYITAVAKTDLLASDDEDLKTSKFASDLANSAVDGLDKVIKERSMSSARKSKEYVEKEINRYLTKLDSVETRLEIFQKENKVLAIDEQTLAIVQQAIEVGTLLAKADLEKNLAQLEYQQNSPQYQFYNKQYDLLSEQYKKIQTGGLTANESFTIPLDKVPKLIKEYTTLFRERKIIEQVMLYLETQRHQEAIQEKRDVPVVEVLDTAYPADERSSPKRTIMVLLGFILAFIFTTIFISGRALFAHNLYLREPNLTDTK